MSTDKEELFAWRRDPAVSFSDWTIRVTLQCSDDMMSNDYCEERNHTETTSSETHSVYHVHRVYLASGPRKSEYFETLFSVPAKTKEFETRTTELSLPESAFSAFPRFLDYVYENTEEIGPTEDDLTRRAMVVESAACHELVGLAFLADYLQVPKLEKLIRRQINHVLNTKHSSVHSVAPLASLYNIGWIITECIQVVAKSPKDLLRPSNGEEETSLSRKFLEQLPLEQQNILLELSLSNYLKVIEGIPSASFGEEESVTTTKRRRIVRARRPAPARNQHLGP